MAELVRLPQARLVVEPARISGLTLSIETGKLLPPTDVAGARSEISGICYRPGEKLASIELRDDETALPADVSLGLPSPVIKQRFPEFPESGAARFTVMFDADFAAGRPWLRLFGRFSDGAAQQLALIHIMESRAVAVLAPYVATVSYEGHRFRFYVANDTDTIQGRHHGKGVFYETAILEYLRDTCPEGMMIVDVGANVGNHAVYFEKIMKAREVVVFEPNAPALAVLEKNIALNECLNINTRYVEYGVGDMAGRYRIGAMPATNWGGTNLLSDPEGPIRSVSLDDVLGALPVGLIKIDVEGMEAAVLRGAAKLAMTAAPVIVVEVTPESAAEVMALLSSYGYRIERTFSMYLDIATLVAVPTKLFADR